MTARENISELLSSLAGRKPPKRKSSGFSVSSSIVAIPDALTRFRRWWVSDAHLSEPAVSASDIQFALIGGGTEYPIGLLTVCDPNNDSFSEQNTLLCLECIVQMATHFMHKSLLSSVETALLNLDDSTLIKCAFSFHLSQKSTENIAGTMISIFHNRLGVELSKIFGSESLDQGQKDFSDWQIRQERERKAAAAALSSTSGDGRILDTSIKSGIVDSTAVDASGEGDINSMEKWAEVPDWLLSTGVGDSGDAGGLFSSVLDTLDAMNQDDDTQAMDDATAAFLGSDRSGSPRPQRIPTVKKSTIGRSLLTALKQADLMLEDPLGLATPEEVTQAVWRFDDNRRELEALRLRAPMAMMSDDDYYSKGSPSLISELFDGATYLAEVHAAVKFESLEQGIKRIEKKAQDQSLKMKSLVGSHFGQFVQCKLTIDEIDEMLSGRTAPVREIEKDLAAASSASSSLSSMSSKKTSVVDLLVQKKDLDSSKAVKSLIAASNDLLKSMQTSEAIASTTYFPLLERTREAQKIQTALRLLKQPSVRLIVSLPHSMRHHILMRNFEMVVRLYKRAKSLRSHLGKCDSRDGRKESQKTGSEKTAVSEVNFVVELFQECDMIVESLRQSLLSELKQCKEVTDEEERLIALLTELDCDENPAIYLLRERFAKICSLLDSKIPLSRRESRKRSSVSAESATPAPVPGVVVSPPTAAERRSSVDRMLRAGRRADASRRGSASSAHSDSYYALTLTDEKLTEPSVSHTQSVSSGIGSGRLDPAGFAHVSGVQSSHEHTIAYYETLVANVESEETLFIKEITMVFNNEMLAFWKFGVSIAAGRFESSNPSVSGVVSSSSIRGRSSALFKKSSTVDGNNTNNHQTSPVLSLNSRYQMKQARQLFEQLVARYAAHVRESFRRLWTVYRTVSFRLESKLKRGKDSSVNAGGPPPLSSSSLSASSAVDAKDSRSSGVSATAAEDLGNSLLNGASSMVSHSHQSPSVKLSMRGAHENVRHLLNSYRGLQATNIPASCLIEIDEVMSFITEKYLNDLFSNTLDRVGSMMHSSSLMMAATGGSGSSLSSSSTYQSGFGGNSGLLIGQYSGQLRANRESSLALTFESLILSTLDLAESIGVDVLYQSDEGKKGGMKGKDSGSSGIECEENMDELIDRLDTFAINEIIHQVTAEDRGADEDKAEEKEEKEDAHGMSDLGKSKRTAMMMRMNSEWLVPLIGTFFVNSCTTFCDVIHSWASRTEDSESVLMAMRTGIVGRTVIMDDLWRRLFRNGRLVDEVYHSVIEQSFKKEVDLLFDSLRRVCLARYLRLKTMQVGRLIEESIVCVAWNETSVVKWTISNAGNGTEIRHHCLDVLLRMVFIHKEVYSLVRSELSSVIGALVSSIADCYYSAMLELDQPPPSTAFQLLCEVDFLCDCMAEFILPSAKLVFEQIRRLLLQTIGGSLITEEIAAQIEDQIAMVKVRCHRSTFVMFACFKKSEGSSFGSKADDLSREYSQTATHSDYYQFYKS